MHYSWQECIKTCHDVDTLVMFASLVMSYVKNPSVHVDRAFDAFEKRDKGATPKQVQSLVAALATEVLDMIMQRNFFGDMSVPNPRSEWNGWWDVMSGEQTKSVSTKQRCYDIYDNNDVMVYNRITLEEAKDVIYSNKSIGIHSARSSRVVYRSTSGREFVIAIAGPFGSINFIDATDQERQFLLDRDYE